jgi:RNA polymerase sigma factor (sigma-70 family)
MEQTSTAGLTAALRWRRGPALRSQATRGDDAALAAMYERHHQALYRYCRSILHDDEDARDALQSTMAKALAALRSEERDFELRPWLFRIAHNEAISRLRQRRQAVDLDAIETLGTDSLAQAVEDRERLALLRADLRDLPERQRSALVLRELSGLSHEEIADVLDTSARAVKQKIFEARTALHECAEGRTMLCADVQRALSDGDGRVLRGRRLRAHVRSCRACRQFKVALAQRPADLALLVPALPSGAGAALLAHLLPGAKAALTSGAGSAAGAGGAVSAGTAASAGGGVASTAGAGVAATVATKVAIVAVATATLGGASAVVYDATAPHASRARPAVVSTPPAGARPASTPASLRPGGGASAAGSALGAQAPGQALKGRRGASGPRASAKGKAVKAAGAPPAHGKHAGNGNATGQGKGQGSSSHGRRSTPKHGKAHSAHPAKGRASKSPAVKAHPAPKHATGGAAPPAHGQPAGARDPEAATDVAPAAETPAADTPPGNSGAAHAAK